MSSGLVQYLNAFCGRFIKIKGGGSEGQDVQAWASLFHKFHFNVNILKNDFSYAAINFQKTVSFKKLELGQIWYFGNQLHYM